MTLLSDLERLDKERCDANTIGDEYVGTVKLGRYAATHMPEIIAGLKAAEEMREALAELVRLKDAKAAGFKTYVEDEAYRSAKVIAWDRARAALRLGAAGEETP